MSLQIGDIAPDFNLPIDGDDRLSLKQLSGKNIVLYFYPKDMTPGCTSEAINFRDRAKDFESYNTVIIGASKDSPARHEKFKTKHALNFQLLADERGTLCETYGVWQLKQFMGRKFMGIVRTTFLIDNNGVVRQIWSKVKVKGHAEAVFNAAKNLSSSQVR